MRRRRPDRVLFLTAVPGRRNVCYTPLDVDGPLLVAMVWAVLAIRRDLLVHFERLVVRHGDLVVFPMPRMLVLLVNESDGARRVLVDNARAYSKAMVQYGALSVVTGSGLLISDGEEWRRRRRVVQSAFHYGSLDVVAEQSVAAGRRVADGWQAQSDGSVVDVDAVCVRAMLEVVGRTLFEVDLADDGEVVVVAVQQALEVVVV